MTNSARTSCSSNVTVTSERWSDKEEKDVTPQGTFDRIDFGALMLGKPVGRRVYRKHDDDPDSRISRFANAVLLRHPQASRSTKLRMHTRRSNLS